MDCTSFYNFLRKNRDSVTTAFEVGVSVRGPQVARAVSEFEEAVTPGNNPAAYSMAGIVMVGFKQCGSKAVLGNARGLVKNALYRSQDLNELIAEVKRDGVSADRQRREDEALSFLEKLKIETTVSDYIPEEKEAYKDFEDAGGEISDATRIGITKEKFREDLSTLYDSHVKMEACKHGPDELLEK